MQSKQINKQMHLNNTLRVYEEKCVLKVLKFIKNINLRFSNSGLPRKYRNRITGTAKILIVILIRFRISLEY